MKFHRDHFGHIDWEETSHFATRQVISWLVGAAVLVGTIYLYL